jgi:SAM-dependent methyltransferase
MFGAESGKPPKWLAAPLKVLTRRSPKLNAAVWSAQYRLGMWKYLDDDVSTGSEILALVAEYAENPTILDLGCGTSANVPLIPGRYRHYHGVDVSATAVREGEALGRPNSSFEVADILTYSTSERYDAILLREVLYYFPPEQVVGLLRRLAGFLEPDGRIFIQMFESAGYDEIVRVSGLPVLTFRTDTSEDGSTGGALIVLAGADAGQSPPTGGLTLTAGESDTTRPSAGQSPGAEAG